MWKIAGSVKGTHNVPKWYFSLQFGISDATQLSLGGAVASFQNDDRLIDADGSVGGQCRAARFA
jgi:hypothetical protein